MHTPSADPRPIHRQPDARELGSRASASTRTPLFVADWRRVVFVHFAVRPADLAPHVPHPLEIVDGQAFVSLVSFSLDHLRPAGPIPSRLGRTLLGPIFKHAFLNLRTYVRGPAGPGVHFLTEWVDNPLSAHLGPLTYGFPFRLATIQRVDLPAGGLTQIRVTESGSGDGIGITVPYAPGAPVAPSREGSLDALLVERYTAYTRRRGVDRFFHIAHRPWDLARVDLVRTDTSLLETLHPWFKRAELISAHIGPGAEGVVIGRPHRCDGARLPDAIPAHAPLHTGATAIVQAAE